MNNMCTVLPMKEPVEARPLCVGDIQTFREDLINIHMDGQVSIGQMYVAAKYHLDQKYYYYPDMTIDEVLLFNCCHYSKGKEGRGELPVFHPDFQYPDTSKEAEARCSFEYRMGFFYKLVQSFLSLPLSWVMVRKG